MSSMPISMQVAFALQIFAGVLGLCLIIFLFARSGK
jgi:hypothetical protein